MVASSPQSAEGETRMICCSGKRACAEDRHLLNGLNVHAGKLTYAAVGAALGLPVISAAEALAI